MCLMMMNTILKLKKFKKWIRTLMMTKILNGTIRSMKRTILTIN